tara:strand:+ start:200 stop:868 length:669 start_codon:yes stop_codon:yes gene_type:complete
MVDFSTPEPHLLPVVGLTGGIGSGKTTAANIFSAIGIPVYHADERAKLLYQKYESLRSWVVGRFGGECGVYNNGVLVDIHHAALAAIVFSNASALVELNEAVHPLVQRDFEEWRAFKSKHSDAPFVMREAAILIESGIHEQCDSVVSIHAPKHLRISRTMARMDVDMTDVQNRMDRQISDEERKEYADFILNNAEDSALIRQVLHVYKQLVMNHDPRDRKTP